MELDGAQEVFTVGVGYDTLELYGKVSAQRTVTVRRDSPPSAQ